MRAEAGRTPPSLEIRPTPGPRGPPPIEARSGPAVGPGLLSLPPAEPRFARKNRPECHPSRPVFARSLCRSCYNRIYQRGLRRRIVILDREAAVIYDEEAKARGLSRTAFVRQLAREIKRARSHRRGVLTRQLQRAGLSPGPVGFPRKCSCGALLFSHAMEQKHREARPHAEVDVGLADLDVLETALAGAGR